MYVACGRYFTLVDNIHRTPCIHSSRYADSLGAHPRCYRRVLSTPHVGMFTLQASCSNLNCITFFLNVFTFIHVAYSTNNRGNEIEVPDIQTKQHYKVQYRHNISVPQRYLYTETQTNRDRYVHRQTGRGLSHILFAQTPDYQIQRG